MFLPRGQELQKRGQVKTIASILLPSLCYLLGIRWEMKSQHIFRCASISWFQVVSNWVRDVFRLAHLRVFQRYRNKNCHPVYQTFLKGLWWSRGNAKEKTMEGTCHFVKVFFPPAFEFIILSSTTSLFSELCLLILERMVSMQPNMYSKVFTSLWWYLQGIFSQRQEDKSNPQECAQICARSWTSSWWSKSDEDNGRCESLSNKNILKEEYHQRWEYRCKHLIKAITS